MGTLYENIKELCDERGIKASNFGIYITGSKSFMSELKSGRKTGVNASTAQKIADYFGVSVDRILYGKREETKNPATEVTGSSLDDALISMIVELTPDELEKVKSFIAGLMANRG